MRTDREPRDAGRTLLVYGSVVFLIAFAVRLLHVWQLRSAPFFDVLIGDARAYDAWAQRIAAGDWFGNEVFYQAPLYPYFLGTLYSIAGRDLLIVRVCQAVIGSASSVLLGLAAARLFSARAGLIAGLALALYAPAIFFDSLIQKSVLDVFFVCLAMSLLSGLVREPRRLASWLGLGLVMGGLSLTRENALVLVAVIVLWITVRLKADTTSAKVRLKADATTEKVRLKPDTTSGKRKPRAKDSYVASAFRRTRDESSDVVSAFRRKGPFSRTRALGAFLFGLATVLLPVAARNYAVGGGFYLTTSQLGPNFFIGNNPRADGTYMSLRYGRGAPEYERQDATQLAEHAMGRRLTPSEVSSYWTDRAFVFITTQPGAWLKLLARKFLLLWNADEMVDTESQETYAEWSWPLRIGGWVGHFGILVPLALLGVWVTWPDRRKLWVFYVMTIAYSASVVLFYVFARYRFPLVPLLILFAAPGVLALLQIVGYDVRAWAREEKAVAVPAETAAPAAMSRRGRHANPRRGIGVSSRWGWGPSASGKMLMAAALVIAVLFTNWPVLSKPLMQAITENNLATALQAEGRLDEAISHYRRAIEFRPDYAPAYSNLGAALRAKGRLDEAVATYQRALTLEPDFPDAHYNLANALLDKDRPDEAAEHFRRALRSVPASGNVHNNLGIALAAEGKLDEAVAAFREAVKVEPDSAKAHRNLGDALSSLGRHPEAIAHFRRAVELEPSDGAAHYDLGSVLLEAGRIEEAIVEFRAALERTPESVAAHNNLGIALASQGHFDEAIAHFQQALRIQPDFADAKKNLALALQARTQLAR